MIGNIIIGLILSVMRFTQPKKKRMFTESDAKKAILKVAEIYGNDAAALVEKIFRLETSHFKSAAYKLTGSAGMEATKSLYPYGWTSAADLWLTGNKPTGILNMKENGTYKTKSFLKFPSVTAAALTIAHILKKRNWNGGAWYSTIESQQQKYNSVLNGIKAKFVQQ